MAVSNHKDQDVPFFVSSEDEPEEEEVFSSVGQHSAREPYTSAPPPVPGGGQRPPFSTPRPSSTGGFRAITQNPTQPYLEVTDEQGQALRPIQLHPQRTTLGTSPQCDTSLQSNYVSPWHASITRNAQGQVLLEDMQSTNGVFLCIADDFQLEDGDEIALGRQRFIFRTTTTPPSLITPPPHVTTPLLGAPVQGAFPHLIRLLAGGLIGGLYPLQGGLTIGRGAVEVSCPEDFSLEDRHARIERRGPQFTLQDLGSREGTYLRVTSPVELFPGDRFMLGAMQFCLRAPTA